MKINLIFFCFFFCLTLLFIFLCINYVCLWQLLSMASFITGCIQIKDEKKLPAATQPPPPLSVIPGGFLKQLVRETEKETKQKEPELKEEKAVSSCSVSPIWVIWCLFLVNMFFTPVRLLWFLPFIAKQTKREPSPAVPPSRPNSTHLGGRDGPQGRANGQYYPKREKNIHLKTEPESMRH